MRILSLVFVLLAGCQSTPNSESDFYTWVDETGQIRTIQKQAKKPSSTKQAPSKENPVSTQNKNRYEFDTDDFTPSEDIEKKLSNEKMFAWQGPDGEQIVREETIASTKEIDQSIASNAIPEVNLKVYRQGKQVLFSNIDGAVFDLNRYYQFNEHSQSDYVLFELTESINQIQLKTFINKHSVAMPKITPLTAEFTQVFSFENPYQYREPESWHGYGYLHGVLTIPRNTRYLLLTPSDQSGVIEAEGEVIRQSNLGKLVLISVN